jgi:ABC-2 type transport system permease protein
VFALKLLKVFYRTSIQTDMEYRADFFTRVVATGVRLLTNIAGLKIAFSYTPTLRGWTFAQVLVLFAVFHFVDAVIETFIAPNMRNVMTQVREGTLDFVLMKPVNTQFMASFRTLNIWQLAGAFLGIGLLVYTLQNLSLEIGPAQTLLFAATLLTGLTIIYSFWLVLVTLTFWFVRFDNVEQIMWQAYVAGRYPMEIYPGWLRRVLTSVIPVAFVVTIPAEALSGRLAAGTLLMSAVVGVTALAASSLFWRFGLKNYTGASA